MMPSPPNFRHEMMVPEGLQPLVRCVTFPNPNSGKPEIRLFLYDTNPDGALPAVLLVHGLADEADTWRHVIVPLSKSMRVIAPDLPGFGRTSKPRVAYTLDFYVDFVFALLDALELQRVSLIGSSLGGVIAHLTTLQDAKRVQRLVLVSGCAVVGRPGRASLGMVVRALPGIGELLYSRLRADPHAAFETLRGYYADFDGLPVADRDFLFQRVNERVWSDDQRRAYLSVRRNLPRWFARHRDVQASVAGIATPTLVVWGEDDLVLPVTVGYHLARVQPTAQLRTIPSCGHLPQQERPAALLSLMTPFLHGSG